MIKFFQNERYINFIERKGIMKNYIGLLCVSLLLLSGCGKSKKSHKKPQNHYFKKNQKNNSSVNSKKTSRALQENLAAFALEKDTVSQETFALSNKDMNLFAFDNSSKSIDDSNENALFTWDTAKTNDTQNKYDTLYFDFDKYTLAEAQKDRLKRDIELAKKEQCVVQDGSGSTIVVEGHSCHSAGSAAYNLALSEKRARYVAEQLIAQGGIDKEHLRIAPRGQEMPIVQKGNKSAQAPNRRVEMFSIDTNK
jgi:outer membrane protein OmpA-like peptidoglycan-associated protein